MKYQLNPLLLEMSTRQLLKKRKLYTPEQWRSMMDKLQKIGKKPGSKVTGLHNATEYGKRMIAGQKLRGQKLAKQHGRNLLVYKDFVNNANGSTAINPFDKIDTIKYSANPFLKRKEIGKRITDEFEIRKLKDKDPDVSKLSRKQIRKFVNSMSKPKANKTLTQAETLAHEMDEYSLGLSSAKKLGLSHGDYGPASGTHGGFFAKALGNGTNVQSSRSSHNPGVLDREVKRIHKLNTLYGRDALASPSRDAEQFAKNSKKYVYNHPKTKEYLSKHSEDPSLREKALASLRRDRDVKHNKEILQKANTYGFNKMTRKQLDAECDKLFDRKRINEEINSEVEKLGIKKFIPDPNYNPNDKISLKSSTIPEGMMISPEYRNFARKLGYKFEKKKEWITKYLDYLDEKMGKK